MPRVAVIHRSLSDDDKNTQNYVTSEIKMGFDKELFFEMKYVNVC